MLSFTVNLPWFSKTAQNVHCIFDFPAGLAEELGCSYLSDIRV